MLVTIGRITRPLARTTIGRYAVQDCWRWSGYLPPGRDVITKSSAGLPMTPPDFPSKPCRPFDGEAPSPLCFDEFSFFILIHLYPVFREFSSCTCIVFFCNVKE